MVSFMQTRNPLMVTIFEGEILFREQRAKDSLAEFTTGAKGRVPTPREFGIIASDYVLLRDYTDADRWFTKATAGDPLEASYWYLLGRTRYKEGQYEEAVSAFEHALSLHPRYVEAENNRGLALSVLQKKDLAIQAYQQAIDWQGSSGTDAQPYFNLGTLLLEQNDLTKAADLLKKAVCSIAFRIPGCTRNWGRPMSSKVIWLWPSMNWRWRVSLSPETSSLHYRLAQIYKKTVEGRPGGARVRYLREAGRHAFLHCDPEPLRAGIGLVRRLR